MPNNLALLDTNVLVYAFYQDFEHYQASYHLLNQAQNDDAALCVIPQVIAEFYSVITNPRRVSSSFEPGDALDEIKSIRALPGLTLLPVPLDVVDRMTELLHSYPVIGRRVFDVQIVATMLGNDVQRIYTFDTTHFIQFDEIDVLTP